jgi:hypothetical protein
MTLPQKLVPGNSHFRAEAGIAAGRIYR